MPGNCARGSSSSSGYNIICQNPSTLAYFTPRYVKGVGAKFDMIPNSPRFERMTSHGPAACGKISHHAALSGGTGAHHCSGYLPSRVLVAQLAKYRASVSVELRRKDCPTKNTEDG